MKAKDIRESWKHIETKKMTFDEAIRYCEEQASFRESWAMSYHRDYYANEEEDYDFLLKEETSCLEDARRYIQIIEWLKNYQRLLKAIDDIKAEFVKKYPKNYAGDLESGGNSCVFSLNKVLEIIDKHMKEGEV